MRFRYGLASTIECAVSAFCTDFGAPLRRAAKVLPAARAAGRGRARRPWGATWGQMAPNDHFCNGRTRRSPGLARPGVARLAETPCCTGRCLICVVWVPGAGACQEAPQTRGVQGRKEGLLARRTPGRDLRSRQSVTTEKVCWRASSTRPPQKPAGQPARA